LGCNHQHAIDRVALVSENIGGPSARGVKSIV
jgi:hypothetical protein